MHVRDSEVRSRVFEVAVGVRDEELVCRKILFDDVPRSAGKTQAFALADGVKPNAFVFAQDFVRLDVDDLAFAFAQMVTHKLGVLYFAEKTNPLAILAFAIRQVELQRHAANLLLDEMPNRKPKPRKLLLVQARQKVGLVFHRIGRTLQEKL